MGARDLRLGLGRRLRGAPHGRERGASIVELVAVIALLGIVLGTVYAGIDSIRNGVEGTDRRLQNLDEARILMATVSKDLRTATRLSPGGTPFLVAESSRVQFYANLNRTTGPKRVTIFIDANAQLVEQSQDPDAASVPPNYTYGTQPLRTRFVGRYVANPGARPIFTYLDSNGNALPMVGGALSADDRLRVSAVRITLVIRKSTNLQVAPTTLVNKVRLPNLDQNIVQG